MQTTNKIIKDYPGSEKWKQLHNTYSVVNNKNSNCISTPEKENKKQILSNQISSLSVDSYESYLWEKKKLQTENPACLKLIDAIFKAVYSRQIKRHLYSIIKENE